VGFWLRSMAHKASGMATITIAKEVAEAVTPEAIARLRPAPLVEGSKILVSARGLTPVLRYALKEAKLHNAVLCVLYVKEIAILLGGEPRSDLGRKPKWQDDPQASAIMSLMLKLGGEMEVCVQPIYAVSTDPATTIVDVAATLGADLVMLGSAHRSNMARLLKGNVVEQVARALPEDIELVIHG
jgi:nucleotide-binding universal stress UspA family protein